MNRIFTLLCLASMALATGCRARQLQHDQDSIRVAIMNMYSNQIMDNLIRAHQGYPFVQVDYTSVTGQITQESNGELHGESPASLWTFGLGASQNNQLSINAAPVLDNDEVYHSYLRFARDPDKFIVTKTPPPPGAAHVSACCNRMYYWVPVDQADAYQRLALSVTVTRGRNYSDVKDYYVAVVQGFLPTPTFKDHEAMETQGKKLTNFDYHIELDTEVPKDHEGEMSAVINGTVVKFNVQPVSLKELKDIKDAGERNILRITMDSEIGMPSTLAELREQLPGQTVKIKLNTIRPAAPKTPDDTLKGIQREMQLFRLNQLLGR